MDKRFIGSGAKKILPFDYDLLGWRRVRNTMRVDDVTHLCGFTVENCVIMRTMIERISLGTTLALVILAGLIFYRLQAPRQLAGLVSDAETQAPLPGATVSVRDNRAPTNAEGEYAVAIPRGKFTLTAEADGYAASLVEVDSSNPFALLPAVHFALAPNHVTGIARDAETSQPVANSTVQAGTNKVTANAQGAFALRAVKNGTPILVTAPGYQPAALVFDGQDQVDLVLAPNTLTISVTDQYTRQPIASAQVQAGEQTAATDAQGRALLRRVKAGILRASAPGYESASGSTDGRGEAQLKLRPNTLDGVVIDAANGQPISSTLIFLGTTMVTANAQGAFHLDNVPAKAAITVQAPGYRKTQVDVGNVTRREIKLSPFLVKGIHIPFAPTRDYFREQIDMVTKTELNAIVLDVKSERGRVAWDTQVPLAKQIDAAHLSGIDLHEVIERCRISNVYCIARMPVFQDTLLATARPNLAVRYANGVIFTENGGSAAWTNPFNSDVWAYNIALAKEAAALGFDEIQFDYVRFPGRVGNLYYGVENTEEARVNAMRGFLARAQKELRPTGVFISADLFGLTTATDEDQHIGQRLRDLGPYLDYVSPMVYPDTWAEASDLLANGLGIKNCTEAVRCPYDVVYYSYKRAAEKTATKVRLWLQAYPGRGDFGILQYRQQKKAANDAGSSGWMFWNAQGNYDPKMFGPPE